MLTQEEQTRVWELVEPVKTAMLVTLEQDVPQARPMQLVQDEFDGTFYFFTAHPSDKTMEALEHRDVCVAFSCPKSQTYVSLSGQASISKDQALIDKYWNAFIAAWFPNGKEDSTVAILKVACYQGEYWQGEGTKVTQLFKYAKSAISGERPDIGDHGTWS
tara:strand:+ start:1067 stop:1549 length:483 start_codon:yes stop_codon:yes gene_type:complete